MNKAITELKAENDRLKTNNDIYRDALDRLKTNNDIYRDALTELRNWCDAYPLSVFPEPDLDKAHKVLEKNGISLGSIAAHNYRHVLKRVNEITTKALDNE